MNQTYFMPPQSTSQASQNTPLLLLPEQICSKRKPSSSRSEHNTLIRLAESIRRYGILEPLTVRVTGGEGGCPRYELIHGERRFRAACLIGLAKIPCILLRPDDKKCIESAIFDDFKRKNYNFFEQAYAIRRLIGEFGLTQEDVARQLGLSQSAVANKLRLLKLTQKEQELILQAALSERHARTLLRLENEQTRLSALGQVCADKLTVAATEGLVEHMIAAQKARETQKSYVFELAERQNALFEGKNKPFEAKNEPFEAKKEEKTSFFVEETAPTAPPSGICPRKFALRDLRPLYNSIDKSLSIFRKTGMSAECVRRESAEEVEIVISIPKHS